jgi:hypothetical protein
VKRTENYPVEPAGFSSPSPVGIELNKRPKVEGVHFFWDKFIKRTGRKTALMKTDIILVTYFINVQNFSGVRDAHPAQQQEPFLRTT